MESIILAILNHRLSLASKMYGNFKELTQDAQKQSQIINEKRQIALSRLKTVTKPPAHDINKNQSEISDESKPLQPQTLMLLKQENDLLFQEYSENLTAISTAESSIAEIVRLQTHLHETLIYQASSIERILDTSIVTIDNVNKGNKLLANAANGSNLFRWIIVCLLISFSSILIFLHLYTP